MQSGSIYYFHWIEKHHRASWYNNLRSAFSIRRILTRVHQLEASRVCRPFPGRDPSNNRIAFPLAFPFGHPHES